MSNQEVVTTNNFFFIKFACVTFLFVRQPNYLIIIFFFFLDVETIVRKDDDNNNNIVKKNIKLTDHDLNVAVKVGEEIISKWHRLENNLVGSGIQVRENTPSHGQLIYSYPSREALDFGVNEPRRSVNRKPLPSPRIVSNVLIPSIDKQEKMITLAFVQWTQFIGNDLFHTPCNKMIHTERPIECCHYNGKNLSPRFLHPICRPITIPYDDPDYSEERTVCMNYVRSLTSLNEKCNFGPADQMNQATHFLDGSMIYGSTSENVISLRTMKNGKLATTNINGVELLPVSDTPEDNCQLNEEKICFKSGDSRVNMHPHHTAMYTIWVREHNRIAEYLSKINPNWDDDKIFEETRKIVIAQIQHITYKHWIPQIFGQEITHKNNLFVKTKGFSNVYSENIDPSIRNGFAVAGFAFVNSMLKSQLRLYDKNGFHNDSLLLKDYFNKPYLLQNPKIFEQLLRGMSYEKSEKLDDSFVKDVTNFLFKGSNRMGHDIMSLDIQRERDHGIPGYNSFRKFCNMSSDDKFDTFLDSIPPNNLNKLKSIYEHPDDVDLIAGAISEIPKYGSRLGPVFQCIIKEQFKNTREGDIYFYDIGGKPHSFKEGQLNEIKKATLSRIFCDNVKEIKKIQLDIFNVPSVKNPLFDCDDPTSPIQRLNLNLWRSKV
ncbi:Peroxidase precursor, putative [Pediculus humanus corporis]|uniref:Peroxidase, putative n=1 Tax=Pediculus humanus subsp. corporis TaxID=121224 RepID=E0VD08_PEDHC|nr:Peroxidase precursor, putative [Pediculus humanus corporis]EEB11264.1 Peroxidase precursor, putative [Pediculus humanus corporis]